MLTIPPSPDLRRSNRLPLSLHRTPLPRTLHSTHPLHLRLGPDPLHPMDRALRPLWKHVYQGGCGGECRNQEDEECGLD